MQEKLIKERVAELERVVEDMRTQVMQLKVETYVNQMQHKEKLVLLAKEISDMADHIKYEAMSLERETYL